MKFRVSMSLSMVATFCVASVAPTWAADYTAKVTWVQALSGTQDCIYFTLSGVSQADAVAPGNPWFAISRAQYGAKDAYAMLLTAKAADSPVRVTTSGYATCGGYAQIDQLLLP